MMVLMFVYIFPS